MSLENPTPNQLKILEKAKKEAVITPTGRKFMYDLMLKVQHKVRYFNYIEKPNQTNGFKVVKETTGYGFVFEDFELTNVYSKYWKLVKCGIEERRKRTDKKRRK